MEAILPVRSALGLLGMEVREVRVYEHLASSGSNDAAGLALGIGVTRAQAYRALSLLLRRGHVALEATEPVTYRAVDPREHAENACRAEGHHDSALVRARGAFLAQVSAAQAPLPPKHALWKVRRVTGQHSFHAAARRLVRKARSSVLISYPTCASKRDEQARTILLEVAEQKRVEGVRLRIITRSPPAGEGAVEPPPMFLVIDGRECLFLASHAGPMGATPQGCWTSVGPLVTLAEMLHDELWQASGT